ncbi:MAG: DUF1800 family protein [Puniceicoccales bacterium]
MKTIPIGIIALAGIFTTNAFAQIDGNGNQQSDIWETEFQAFDLSPDGDADGDGQSNAAEAAAGTNPFDPQSKFAAHTMGRNGSMIAIGFDGERGKVYDIEYCPILGESPWSVIGAVVGEDAAQEALVDFSTNPGFYRLVARDVDSDGDGVQDWEELAVGFDPTTGNTDRYDDTDLERIQAALAAENSISLVLVDGEVVESWPDPGLIAVVRTGGLDPLTVSLNVSGTATAGDDFLSFPSQATFAAGQSVAWILVYPVNDDTSEVAETVTVTLAPGAGYSVATPGSATVTLFDADPAGLPSAEEAARFLAQATFGPTPDTIAEVQAVGFEQWIEDQFNAPVGRHLPVLESFPWGNGMEGPYTHHKMLAWWEQAMNAPDPLRQRLGFALSEIIVISDYDGDLEGNSFGMFHFYDMLLENAFGNYRELLEDVTYHPCMGVYLSHMGNRPADPAINLFPDENYAREIMQLFSIGLWMLNNDGTLMLHNGQPIPTYDNDDITNLAGVFTGMTWGVSTAHNWWHFFWPETELEHWQWYFYPMSVWNGPFEQWNEDTRQIDLIYYHDQGAKTILGETLPANDPENPEADYAVNDIGRALDVIFNHPNVGPFISRLLIQRMVSSNPSNAYVARVAEAFNGGGPHNPEGIRGDMESVVRAILLDDEARNPAMLDDPEHGMLRENYLRLVALARAFRASSPNGVYPVYWLQDSYGMRPMSSPSVFNFFSPSHQPLGDIRDAGLVAPEFEILTAVTGITIPNHLRLVADDRLSWAGEDGDVVRLDLSESMALANDHDALIAHLDLLITGGTLSPDMHALLREMLNRPEFNNADDDFVVHSLIYLIACSADAAVLR